MSEENHLPFEKPNSKTVLEPSLNSDARSVSDHPAAYDLLKISELSRTRVADLAKVDPRDCQAAYLFRSDYFCGVRYSAGNFTATWLLGDNEIQFFRSQTPIGVISIDPERKQAA